MAPGIKNNIVITLAIAASGGYGLSLLSFPAGWLCGAALATTIAAAVRIPVELPSRLRWPSFLIMGMSMGGALGPETFSEISRWPASITLMLLSVLASFVLGTLYLSKVHNWDRATARLSAAPGALSTVLALATDTSAKLPVVALSHALRQLFLICLVPLVFSLGSTDVIGHGRPVASLPDFVLTAVAAVIGIALFRLARVPSAMLLGSMVGSAAIHLSGYATGVPHPILQQLSFIIIGAATGAGFRGMAKSTLKAAVGPAMGCILVAVGVAAVFAFIAHYALKMPAAHVWLAYAPGGVEGMNAIAMAMNIDPAFVSIHHAVRLFALMLLSPVWASSIMGRPKNLIND